MSPVFNEAKYRALLENLEISVITNVNLENLFTIGAEFYQKQYLAPLSLMVENVKEIKTLKQISSLITDGDHGAPDYQESGILYLLSESIQEGYINDSVYRYITPSLHQALKRSQLKSGDILVTKTGVYFGKSTVIPASFPEANTSAHVGIIRISDTNINPYYLSTFINCLYGHVQFRRRGIKATRPEIKLVEFDDIKIPVLAKKFQDNLSEFIQYANKKRQESVDIYSLAEQLLLQELGLIDWQPDDESVATKTFADFQNSGRLDAEYYQPKYDDLLKRIGSFENFRLRDVVNIKKSIEPGSDAYQEDGVPFVRVSDITKFGITPPEIHLDRMVYYSEHLTPKKDTILLSKDGSVGIAYKVDEDLDVITSGALLHLTIKNPDFLPDYLTLVLNSIVVKLQAERDAGGSIIQHWKPSEIENVIVPKLPMPIQEQIAAKVQESFALRKESKCLLNLAKHAVEVAIEQGEDAAMKLLEDVKNA